MRVDLVDNQHPVPPLQIFWVVVVLRHPYQQAGNPLDEGLRALAKDVEGQIAVRRVEQWEKAVVVLIDPHEPNRIALHHLRRDGRRSVDDSPNRRLTPAIGPVVKLDYLLHHRFIADGRGVGLDKLQPLTQLRTQFA